MKIARIVFFMFMILLSGCVRKKVYFCGMGYAHPPSLQSSVLKLERVAIADTTIASVFGTVIGRDSTEYGVYIDSLGFATIAVTNSTLAKPIAVMADSTGHFQLHVPASTYELRAQFITFNTLIIRDVVVGTGDMIRFDALLGQSANIGDSCVYQMQPDKSLKLIYSPVGKK